MQTYFMADNGTVSQPIMSKPKQERFSEQKAMTRAAGVVGFWTTLSRILGFVRDMVIALFMGAGPGADAFFVAFRIPNLLRRLSAEGAFSAAFIPTYVETLQKNGNSEAARLARITFTFAAIVLGAMTVLGIIFSPWIVRAVAPGFIDNLSKFELTVHLNRIMFPYIFLVSLVALASGVLNSMGHFGAPAAAPVLLNLAMIASVTVFCTYFNVEPAYALAWGVVAGGILQLLLQLPYLGAVGVGLRPDFHFRYPALKKVGTLFVPAAFGGAVSQINVMVGTILASLLPAGGVSWLYYADRIMELPLGIFAIALGTAVLPSMSRQATSGDLTALSRSVSFALRLTAFFTIPASVALILLRAPIISVLFQRGLFTALDTNATAYALLWYTAGLWAFSGLKVVTQSFYSMMDTRTPVWVAIGAVAVNLAAGLLLMGPMKQGGLALATSLAAAFNVVVLFAILIRRLGQFPTTEFAGSLAKISLASLIMGIPLVYGRTFGDWERGFTPTNGLVLAGCIMVGLIGFAIAAYVLKCKEMRSLLSLLREHKK
ncbi:MAG: murein biosynthesis integral membrane protein MurJ [Desulfomonilaceae bacterium]